MASTPSAIGRSPRHPARRAAVKHIDISGHLYPIQIGDDVENRTFLLDVRRGQIDRQAFLGHLEPRIEDGGIDPVLAFLDRRIGQAHDDCLRVAPTRVDFNFHGVGINTVNRAAMNFGKHTFPSKRINVHQFIG